MNRPHDPYRSSHKYTTSPPQIPSKHAGSSTEIQFYVSANCTESFFLDYEEIKEIVDGILAKD